jgi:hypothetical protein
MTFVARRLSMYLVDPLIPPTWISVSSLPFAENLTIAAIVPGPNAKPSDPSATLILSSAPSKVLTGMV